MAKCIIVGAGLSGLSSAVYLHEAGHTVEIIEASPKLGGRTYSFFDKKFQIEIDNGQHILMGAYVNTLNFLQILKSDQIPKYQSQLSAKLVEKGGIKHNLNAKGKIYPFNLFWAILNFNAINRKEKYLILRYLFFLFFNLDKENKQSDTLAYLKNNHQSEKMIKALWEIIGVGALNTKLDQADVKSFRNLIKKIFFRGNQASTIILPNAPLNKLFIDPTVKYFNDNKIKFSVSEKFIDYDILNRKITNIYTNKREISEFDYLILAIPPGALAKLNDKELLSNTGIEKLETSSIITIHLKTRKDFIFDQFVGLIDSKIDWLFNNGSHISIVISAADNLIAKNDEEIINIVYEEIKKYFNSFDKNEIFEYKILKSKQATIKSSSNNEIIREKISSNYDNLFFAGDWVNTGLPATIEGAILSGRKIVRKII